MEPPARRQKPLEETPSEMRRDPVVEAYKKDIDVTLLIDNLRRSARDRLELMIARQELAEELRRVGPKRAR